MEDKVIYFYGGNIGHAQDMTNLLKLERVDLFGIKSKQQMGLL
ncbi:hypothetical protein AB7X12_12625 [Proteus terrae]